MGGSVGRLHGHHGGRQDINHDIDPARVLGPRPGPNPVAHQGSQSGHHRGAARHPLLRQRKSFFLSDARFLMFVGFVSVSIDRFSCFG